MKLTFKILGIITMVAVVMFGIAACDDNSNEHNQYLKAEFFGTWQWVNTDGGSAVISQTIIINATNFRIRSTQVDTIPATRNHWYLNINTWTPVGNISDHETVGATHYPSGFRLNGTITSREAFPPDGPPREFVSVFIHNNSQSIVIRWENYDTIERIFIRQL